MPEDSVDYIYKKIINVLAEELYKEYDEQTDKEMLKQMLKLYLTEIHSDYIPERWKKISNIDKFVDDLYRKSVFSNKQKFLDSFTKNKNFFKREKRSY